MILGADPWGRRAAEPPADAPPPAVDPYDGVAFAKMIRARRQRRRRRIRLRLASLGRTTTLLVAFALFLAYASGVAHAHWTDSLGMGATVSTGGIDMEVTDLLDKNEYPQLKHFVGSIMS